MHSKVDAVGDSTLSGVGEGGEGNFMWTAKDAYIFASSVSFFEGAATTLLPPHPGSYTTDI